MFWEMIQPYVLWWGKTSLGLWLGASTSRVAWLFIFHLFGITLMLWFSVGVAGRWIAFF